MSLEHFLLVYDIQHAQLVDQLAFGNDVHEATAAYARMEEQYRDRDDSANFEIVLIGADSIETLRVTHSRYFADRDEVLVTERETVPF